MIESTVFSKKVGTQEDRIVVTVPSNIVSDMQISDGDMVQVTLTKRTQYTGQLRCE